MIKQTIATILLTLVILSNLLPNNLAAINGYRNPFTIISWTSGVVLDTDGNGKENAPFTDSYYNYIKYQEGLTPGSEVFTVFIYNPFTLYCDDFVARFDF